MTHLLQKVIPFRFSRTVPLTGDQMLEHMSLWNHYHSKHHRTKDASEIYPVFCSMDGAYDILDSSLKKVKTGLQNVWQVLFDCRWSLKSLLVRQFSAMWALELCQYLSACSDVLGVWHHWGFRPLKITTVFIIAIFQMLVYRRSIKMAEEKPMHWDMVLWEPELTRSYTMDTGNHWYKIWLSCLSL